VQHIVTEAVKNDGRHDARHGGPCVAAFNAVMGGRRHVMATTTRNQRVPLATK